MRYRLGQVNTHTAWCSATQRNASHLLSRHLLSVVSVRSWAELCCVHPKQHNLYSVFSDVSDSIAWTRHGQLHQQPFVYRRKITLRHQHSSIQSEAHFIIGGFGSSLRPLFLYISKFVRRNFHRSFCGVVEMEICGIIKRKCIERSASNWLRLEWMPEPVRKLFRKPKK